MISQAPHPVGSLLCCFSTSMCARVLLWICAQETIYLLLRANMAALFH